MNTPTWIGFAASAGIIALASATDVAGQAATPDPWKMVPAAPITCFLDDGFADKLYAANAAIEAEISRQKTVNAKARERFDKMDMNEKAQRMQAFMMKNPQAAMKMLQAEQAAGATVATSMAELDESAKRLESELARHNASFGSAVDQAVKPVQARQKQLIDAKTVEVGEAAISMFTAASDHAQYVQLIQQENAEHEKACAPYFGAGGTMHKWLSSYRTEVIDKLSSIGDANEAAIVVQMAAMDIPGGGYRSTAALEGARDYVRKLSNVYDVRRQQARPTVELKK